MSIKVSLRHLTSYKYDRPTTLFPQLIRLRPTAHCRTPISDYTLKIKPEKHFINWQQDPFGNFMARVVFPNPEREFEVEVGLLADMTVINPFDFFVEPEAEKFPFVYAPSLKESLSPYLEIKENGLALKAWLKKLMEEFAVQYARELPITVNFLMQLNQQLQKEISYCIRLDPGVQTCEQTLSLASGSCRDSAWLLVQIFRHLGIASRFVSGYLIQLESDIKSIVGPTGPEKDFTDLHAWAEAYIPGAGWIGFDSTSGLMAGEGHIPLSCTPSPEESAPISGGISKSKTTFYHEMEITRLKEDPRITAPIEESDWQELLALGDQIDIDLEEKGLELTQGGEPTFVSTEDIEGPEWNTAALDGKDGKKYLLANRLIWKLKDQFSSGGLLHYGQGKWYPGEPLPRWALTVYWRPDGKPIWHNAALQAKQDLSPNYNAKHGEILIKAMTRILKQNPEFILAGFEDAYHLLWREGNLPVEFDPKNEKLKSESERTKLLQHLDNGLGAVKGYVLPLKASFTGKETHWLSCKWEFRRKNLFLLPGDSPIGYRLPLESLPQEYGPQEFPPELSPLDSRPYLPEYPVPAKILTVKENLNQKLSFRTALCVEVREGFLYVFFPPLPHLESYLELVSVVETAAKETGLCIRLEGYKPGFDPRLSNFSVTPDPGVIEVNIHPSRSWRELVMKTEILYEEARQCRLTAEKFQLDGRHTGTGGGNHIVLGSEKPADSPFLKRPHLLRSLLNFWQNHPSLSYLFSGLFIGPTSQSPRVDEARDDALVELQIAFQQISLQENPPPWQVDRIFRHLLVDLTGNTHRAEFCIDKLYSPDSLTGRLGLLELRGFEMPPHPKLNIAQSLLVRALVSQFWDRPYSAPLQNWGTSLHDRWMLPHFIWKDFEEVIAFINRADINPNELNPNDAYPLGYAIKSEWYSPFLEFRFPKLGDLEIGGISLEVRQAAEPWHVLGEEASGSGTARYVDSSLERIQITLNGLTPKRFALACNGYSVPLSNTGIKGQAVAGLRYRAWHPYSCLHPLIPAHVPLYFDLIDTWNGLSLGGCTYHVAHPAGRNYQTFPVNAAEAEARRNSRFEKNGRQGGPYFLKPTTPHHDHPFTLDLRLYP